MPKAPKRTSAKHGDQKFRWFPLLIGCCLCILCFLSLYAISYSSYFSVRYSDAAATTTPAAPVLNIAAYNAKLLRIANYGTSTPSSLGTTTASTTGNPWPVQTVYPNAGALLPFNRIVAYYGNFYAKGMGVLGKYPPPEMLQMLNAEVAKWQAADPSTPVIPGIDYIAVVAQGSAGTDGKYRARMPDSQLDEAVQLAEEEHGVVILDIQVGLSNVQTEVPLLEKYLKMPQVELALDPEFAMHNGARPGTVIGSLDAADINFAANYLATIVQSYHLPPKILIVHRFTDAMVTHYKKITPLPEVEIVMDMDGWGSQSRKLGTYQQAIAGQPVEFTGFKLFYKNDLLPPSAGIMTPAQLLKLQPQPLFIQFQ